MGPSRINPLLWLPAVTLVIRALRERREGSPLRLPDRLFRDLGGSCAHIARHPPRSWKARLPGFALARAGGFRRLLLVWRGVIDGLGERLVSVVRRQAQWRWVAVVCGVALLCGLPAIVSALPVPASVLSASALRARILASGGVPYQGYAESSVDLGLPELPGLGDVTGLLD